MKKQEIAKVIHTERLYQEQKYNSPQSNVPEYLLYMQNHLSKAIHNITTEDPVELCSTVRAQVRKVTALGHAFGEQHGLCDRAGFEDQYLFVKGDIVKLNTKYVLCEISDEEKAIFSNLYESDGKIKSSPTGMVKINNFGDVGDYIIVDYEEVAEALIEK